MHLTPYCHSSYEYHGHVIVIPHLNNKNYNLWSQSIKVALMSKIK